MLQYSRAFVFAVHAGDTPIHGRPRHSQSAKAGQAPTAFTLVELPAVSKRKAVGFTLVELPAVSKRKAVGFTLVELLVVISIIALLVSIIAPHLGRAKQHARAAKCGSNVHQMAVAMKTYGTTWGYYPGHHLVGPSVAVWPTRVRKYTGGGMGAFNCPSADEAYLWRKQYGSGQPAEHGYEADEVRLTWQSGFTYGYNDWGVREFTDPHLGLGGHCGHSVHGEVRLSRVVLPSDMIALADSKADRVWDTAIDPNDFEDNEWPSKRHFGHSQVAFCDGHVEFISQAKLIEPSHWARRRWNNDHKSHKEFWIDQDPGGG